MMCCFRYVGEVDAGKALKFGFSSFRLKLINRKGFDNIDSYRNIMTMILAIQCWVKYIYILNTYFTQH